MCLPTFHEHSSMIDEVPRGAWVSAPLSISAGDGAKGETEPDPNLLVSASRSPRSSIIIVSLDRTFLRQVTDKYHFVSRFSISSSRTCVTNPSASSTSASGITAEHQYPTSRRTCFGSRSAGWSTTRRCRSPWRTSRIPNSFLKLEPESPSRRNAAAVSWRWGRDGD